MKTMKSILPTTILMILMLTVICGIFYPLVVTGIAQIFFKHKANGSIIEVNNVKYGSELLAQEFTGDEYLWGRVMLSNVETFTDEEGNPLYYAGPSNLTPASEDYRALIAERIAFIEASHSQMSKGKVPVELVTVSGSGLDPHISVNAALYQAERIAQERNMDIEEVEAIIDKYTTPKLFGILGEKVVNVLQVNLKLDGILKD